MRSPARFRTVVALALAAFGLAGPGAAAEALQPGDTVAICGDSITEQKLFSVFMADYLLMCQPAANLGAIQVGWSGEAASGFMRRVEADVVPFHPTVATTLYGMNDGGYNATDPATVAGVTDRAHNPCENASRPTHRPTG